MSSMAESTQVGGAVIAPPDTQTNLEQAAPVAKYRHAYQPPLFSIEKVDLTFDLQPTTTTVTSELLVHRLGEATTLVLDGDQLELISIALDGVALESHQYQVSANSLQVFNLPKRCTLRIITTISPAENTALEGLYLSAGTFCTQCEAEGFRRITYFLDRPDVLSIYRTTLIADKSAYPYLLANGNAIERVDFGDRHAVTWEDPYPKPCYLFALVAGDFDVLTDTFITKDQRSVALELFVDKGNLPKADYAMGALKRAMKWDEERFNLVYDLDIYMIVAVDFFNMGAMENKGLNVFNSKYVLANNATATDQDFLNVESVIGHEYFHNWTGNRITCRDWFQLSLKEGLTVFRDQEFSADLGMRSVNRIQDARIIRTHQFDEDSSPMAHPIRPDRVVEMNNFYTVTVYNKGAEVIRMLHTLLGEEGFQRGMALYVERHDGQAVTCEDFVVAMEDANQVDLRQFRLWYSQAGTPEVSVEEIYDAAEQTFTLKLRQSTPATAGQNRKLPMHIPLRVEFVTMTGEAVDLVNEQGDAVTLIELKHAEQSVTFSNVKEPLVAGLLADFSAPVRLDVERSEAQLLALIAGGRDPFLRWDAVQTFYLQTLDSAISQDQPVQLPQSLVDVLKHELQRPQVDQALLALLLQVPNEEAVSQNYDCIPVAAIASAVANLRVTLAYALQESLIAIIERAKNQVDALDSESIAERMLVNTCMSLAAHIHDNPVVSAYLQAQFNSVNMTLQFGALQAAVHAAHPFAQQFLDTFAQRWSQDVLVMDKWLAVQATSPKLVSVAVIEELTESPYFNWRNPNRIYALLAAFTHNLAALHDESGRGYQFIVAAIRRLNTTNPQVASRLLSPLLKWRKLPLKQQELLKNELISLSQLANLAPDLYEKVNQTLTEN